MFAGALPENAEVRLDRARLIQMHMEHFFVFVENHAPTPAKHTLPEKSPSASHPMAPLRRFGAKSGAQVAESASR